MLQPNLSLRVTRFKTRLQGSIENVLEWYIKQLRYHFRCTYHRLNYNTPINHKNYGPLLQMDCNMHRLWVQMSGGINENGLMEINCESNMTI